MWSFHGPDALCAIEHLYFSLYNDGYMEQHPVPQNVTTFQFRLIGDMTLKQFGYLCAGAILAFIAYKLPLPFIITWPLTGAFAFLGIGFAFIPIEERPMDVWVFSFFKSIYNPTQYIWSHEASMAPPVAKTPPQAPQSTKPVATVPTTPIASPPTPAAKPAVATQTSPKSALSDLFQAGNAGAHQAPHAVSPITVHAQKPHTSFIDEIMSFFRPKHVAAPVQHPAPAPPAPHPVPSVTGQHVEVPQQSATPQPAANAVSEETQRKIKQLEETLATLEARLATKTMTEDRVLELQKQLTETLAAKTNTEEQLVALKRREAPPQPVSPRAATSREDSLSAPSRGTVNVITTQEWAVKVGLPRLTNAPNVITGLVKDDVGNLLPGILVTVTNGEGVPMRALKTNKLGQFAASTPLTSGVYFVEIEDPRGRFTFTRVQITLNGSVVPVLEIIAKSEKALTREKLAQEIFGKTSV